MEVIGWSSSKIVSGSCVVIENSFDPGERLQAVTLSNGLVI
jgi:hypothetical protein